MNPFKHENQKLGIFKPTFASFRGFSFLADHGPAHHRSENGLPPLLYVTPKHAPGLQLYQRLEEGVEEFLSQIERDYFSARLPSSTAHVTAWDGLNEQCISMIHDHAASATRGWFSGLPHSAAHCPPIWPEELQLTFKIPEPLHLKFDRVAIRGDDAVVAFLSPTDDSVGAFKSLCRWRSDLDAKWSALCGKGSSSIFEPHVSLAYCVNQHAAQQVDALLPDLNGRLHDRMLGSVLLVDSLSLYAFTTMTEFFKVAE